MVQIRLVWIFLAAMFLSACSSNQSKKSEKVGVKQQADLLLENAKIYTVNKQFEIAEGLIVKDGKIVFVGLAKDARAKFDCEEILDLSGMAVYPGFIDAHCHFLGYGRTLFDVDLTGTSSFSEVVDRVNQFFGTDHEGWVKGRGWDQNDWEVKDFPTADTFNMLYPNQPLVLRRVDGHAALVNQKALDLAGITEETLVNGGEIQKDKNGKITGILLDNAVDLVMNLVPENIKALDEQALAKAQSNCFAVGLTSLGDAGLPLKDVLFLKDQAETGKLKMRLYQMISHEDEAVEYFKTNGSINLPNFTVNAVKCYMDGALGSRGALLKDDYSDHSGNIGLQLTKDEDFLSLLEWASKANFQVCTHAIGDRAVATVLNDYATTLSGANNKRWRVEHSQVVDKLDLALYGQYAILPSVQPTHATSDMYWAEERLGQRVANAYAYKELLAQNDLIISGSDFPVENINPLFGFYAAVARKDQKGHPAEGYQMENALSREEALKAMTIWAAYGQFQEDIKGSLEVGKYADFVILDRDIMTIPIEETFRAKVHGTFIDGKPVFQAN